MRYLPADLDRLPEVLFASIAVHQPSGDDRFHSHDRWWLHAYTYASPFTVDGEAHELQPGCVSVVPPGSTVRYRFPPDAVHICAHLRLPAGGELLPLLSDLGDDFEIFRRRFAEATTWSGARRAVRLLDLLWELTQSTRADDDGLVERARRIIDRSLADPPTVPQLARRCGCSHNTLTRAFKRDTGFTVVAYLRHRRAEHAAFLLCQSTIPAADIARQVGLGDLQRLNKLLREILGRSPREIRSG